jgi:glyoxylase-like metal-dependent hydrolase (beta-lactamase superfamily II)
MRLRTNLHHHPSRLIFSGSDGKRTEPLRNVGKNTLLVAKGEFQMQIDGKVVTRFEPDQEIAPGITALAAPGHTPGHTVFPIHSGDKSLLVLGDTARHPALFARHPDWQAAFDLDGATAVATRKNLFDRAAADHMLVTGYYFPFPACGHLIKTPTGYEHVPMEWPPTL